MSNLKTLLEYLIREENMYHTTNPKNIPSILSKGLKINPGFDKGGKSRASKEYMEDAYGGIQPIFLSKEPAAYKNGEVLKVDVDGLPLVADIPGLVDFGGELTDHSVYWDEESTPEELWDLTSPETGENVEGELEYEDLREPGPIANAAIGITKTAAVPEDIDPTRIEPLESLFNAWFSKKNIKKHIPKEQLTEAHLGKFNMDVFKKLDTLQKKQNYAKQNLPELGEGSSRTAYALSTSKVLKVVNYEGGSPAAIQRTAERGWAQNKAEIETWTNPKTKAVAARIFDFDPDKYTWLVMEIAQLVDNKQLRFEKELGIPATEYFEMSQLIELIYKPGLVEDFITNLRWAVPVEKAATVRTKIEAFVNNPSEYVKALVELVKNNDLDVGDIHPSHFGKTLDGRIVLFDYGLTMDVYRNHY